MLTYLTDSTMLSKKISTFRVGFNDAVIDEYEQSFSELGTIVFFEGMREIKKNWAKRINLNGSYV